MTDPLNSVRKPLKALHIAPTPFFSDRGCHIRIEGIVKALVKEDVSSIVCTYHHGREIQGVVTRRIGPISRYRSTRPGPNPFKYWADIKLLWLTLKTVWEFQPDILHAHLHEGVLIGWLTRWLMFWRRMPVVADLQGSLVGELDTFGYFDDSPFRLWIFRRIEAWILKLPQHIMASSTSTVKQLQSEYPIENKRLTLLSDRVQDEIISGLPAPAVRLDAPLTLIYSGSLLPGKGLRELHEILNGLLHQRSDLRVILIGYPTESTEAFLEQNGLRDRCELLGKVPYETLHQHLAKADIGIDPKNADSGEGSGKIVNYMAAGLPVACFETGNNRELLGPAVAMVPKNDIDAFIKRLVQLCDDAQKRHAEGVANQMRVKNELSWQSGGRIIRALYDAALAH